MRISQEILEKKIEEVPENIRNHVMSEEVAEKLTKIGQEHGLHIDQMGSLDEETLYVMLGIENTEEFVQRVSSRVGVPIATAESLVKAINNEIFVSVRNSLQREPEAAVYREILDDTINTKESILAEIENPTPTIHPISAADQTVPGPAMPREVISVKTAPSAQPVPVVPPKQTNVPSTTTTDFLTSKLSAPVNNPTQKATDTVPMPSAKPKSYSVDPYREPIA